MFILSTCLLICLFIYFCENIQTTITYLSAYLRRDLNNPFILSAYLLTCCLSPFIKISQITIICLSICEEILRMFILSACLHICLFIYLYENILNDNHLSVCLFAKRIRKSVYPPYLSLYLHIYLPLRRYLKRNQLLVYLRRYLKRKPPACLLAETSRGFVYPFCLPAFAETSQTTPSTCLLAFAETSQTTSSTCLPTCLVLAYSNVTSQT